MSKKYVRRETSYEPPFSGARGQPIVEFNAIHKRWCGKLMGELPEGLPAIEPMRRCRVCGVAVQAHGAVSCRSKKPVEPFTVDDPWPATFGDLAEDGVTPIHRADEGRGYCFQCGNCCYYIPLESRLGGDWGACSNAKSQYDGRVTYEHWSCKEFRF